ncbi:unnamed protein product [Adineta ricciae]|uniref:Uncharacterized protein n=1 Tax=Adineta ricciae TaxID=249248 RepID=A0A813VMP6_ADIRI|nr:unnamed protein product [Adineta ricciae]
MGNIVTPDQGLLPLPSYSGVTTPYPWWLNAALAIWALLALLCCWLLLLLYLLRYCCKWWRHRQYAADRVSLRKRFFGFGSANGQQGAYVTKQQHFATAPLPPIPYAVSDGIYGAAMPYVTSGVVNAYDPGTENIETNIHRNITKNYYINEEKNYFIESDPKVESVERGHDPEVQTLPPPIVTTINMAAERITDNPNWENATTKADLDGQEPKRASAEVVDNDPSINKQGVKAQDPPNVLTHRPETPQGGNRKLGGRGSDLSDDGSTISEMSGHDSESIYETIRVLTPKKEVLPRLEDEDEDGDEYRTAGIDEVEFEVKDLIRLQKANARSGDPYDDILTSTTLPRRHLTHHSPSISSSSTLNNLMPTEPNHNSNDLGAGEEETVTQTVSTQQIQTTVRQIGQQLGNSAFFVPLSSAITHEDGPINDNEKIVVPLSTSSVRYDEKPALQHF